MTDFRMRHSSWYQVPVLYGWWDHTAGASPIRRARRPFDGHGNGGVAATGSEN